MPSTLDACVDVKSVDAQSNVGVSVRLGTVHFKEANEMVREALRKADAVTLHDVFAQRYLGCTMPSGKRLDIFGTPGNDMACYMDGGFIEVHGNAQDQIGNTMNGGTIVIHGRCGDAAGYAMRGGSIFIRDDSGWRVGIHMKQYKDKRPVIVIGGNAGSFLGEYMAGGIILLLGNAGEYMASGMHGGVVYLRDRIADEEVAEGLILEPVDANDIALIGHLISKYNDYFSMDLSSPIDLDASTFYRLRPASSRPYASMYAH